MNDGCFHTILLLLYLRNLSMLCFVTITYTPERWDVEKYNRESCRYISPTQGQLQTSSVTLCRSVLWSHTDSTMINDTEHCSVVLPPQLSSANTTQQSLAAVKHSRLVVVVSWN